jgi:hypothetical protein
MAGLIGQAGTAGQASLIVGDPGTWPESSEFLQAGQVVTG